MKATFATTLLATLFCQAYSASFRLGIKDLQFYAVPEGTTDGAAITFRGPDEEAYLDDTWTFQLPEVRPDTEVLIQHIQTEKYIFCDPGDLQRRCVLSEEGTSFTAYKLDQETGFAMVGLDVEEGQWVLEAGQTLHFTWPAEEVDAQWFSFNTVEE